MLTQQESRDLFTGIYSKVKSFSLSIENLKIISNCIIEYTDKDHTKFTIEDDTPEKEINDLAIISDTLETIKLNGVKTNEILDSIFSFHKDSLYPVISAQMVEQTCLQGKANKC